MGRSLMDRLRSLEQSVRQNVQSTAPSANDHPSGDSNEVLRHLAENKATFAEADSGRTEELSPERSLSEAAFEPCLTPYGRCWRRKTSFDLYTKHGHYLFADILATDFAGLSKLAKSQIDVERLRFYDVETNGLGTGAGTFPFLHTIGCIDEDEFIVTQYFVDDYDAEAAVLFAIGENHLLDDAIIVTFNGKSFDWPLLQNRRVMHQFPRLERVQLDLLHPSRRLFKGQLSRVKLVDLEEHVLGLTRIDDLPGGEAPERYFRYLDTRDVRDVEPVFGHNVLDVCSLVTLQVAIARLLNGEQKDLPSQTHIALATWYDAWHDIHAAGASYEAAVSASDADWKSHWLYSMFLKRRRDDHAACQVWWTMAREYPDHIEPLVELAKCYEHRQKDLDLALQTAEEALRRIVQVKQPTFHIPHRVSSSDDSLGQTPADPLAVALKHRIQRIERKRSRLKRD
ncbi:ribonuclease H-like domain-containing protein [Alicyclobacillus dauci]|uniref:Ribonuclease H-like domain-containing protein n=1 Tax=Alicyclobacillus dauci TaxID=1475485 RepID=A0ABY6Z300_9BACL|nr:ribonuclease H-like domain-containing protein [Alicyclobacillus dauci]WAH36581.1 ribonuclease H-like domain-containing protein [Alicyclobacillus dauci]